jgi:1-aminocyclopropane-1-carboxylate deaminase/D-cysteine desulfhydrase-like pyridoxal-dependent ACC family enzyme
VLQLAGSASVQHERETSVQASAGHSTDAGIRIGLNTLADVNNVLGILDTGQWPKFEEKKMKRMASKTKN